MVTAVNNILYGIFEVAKKVDIKSSHHNKIRL